MPKTRLTDHSSDQRHSNLELLRIVAMLLIVAHHSVVNSGISASFNTTYLSFHTLFLHLWGMWGKTAINTFVLITGYFMCTSKLTWKRFAKIYLEVKFYRFAIYFILLAAGYESFTVSRIWSLFFSLAIGVNSSFTSSFLAFYLFIPFYNALIDKLGPRLWQLVLGLLALFTIPATFFSNTSIFHYVGWYATLYFAAAYLRLYPNKWTESRRFCTFAFGASVLLGWGSVLYREYCAAVNDIRMSTSQIYFLVSDSNKLLALLVGVSAFLFFKNLRIPQNRTLNTIASTTFGVLLIHSNSSAMRTWLWQDFLNVPAMYQLPLIRLILTEGIMAVGIFAVCSALDLLRLRLLERPCMRWLARRTECIENGAKSALRILQSVGQWLGRLLSPLL